MLKICFPKQIISKWWRPGTRKLINFFSVFSLLSVGKSGEPIEGWGQAPTTFLTVLHPAPRASEQRKTQSENYFSIVLGYFSFPFRTQSLWLLFYSIIWWLLNLVDDLENAIRWFNEAKFGSIRVELGGSGPVRPRRCFLCPAQSQTKPAELPALQTQKEIINQ